MAPHIGEVYDVVPIDYLNAITFIFKKTYMAYEYESKLCHFRELSSLSLFCCSLSLLL